MSKSSRIPFKGLIAGLILCSGITHSQNEFEKMHRAADVTINNQAIEAPELISPPDSSQNMSTSVELVWSSVPGAFYFQVQLSSSEEFSDVLIDTLLLLDTTLTVTGLNYSTFYYWRVKAEGELAVSDWSETFSFTTEIPVAVQEIDQQIPEEFMLKQNYPNPFNPSTTIQYGLPFESRVKLGVYDMQGQLVGVLVDENQSAGIKEKVWQTRNLASGIYFVRLTAKPVDGRKDFTAAKKIILLK
jgi:hypothetical protein